MESPNWGPVAVFTTNFRGDNVIWFCPMNLGISRHYHLCLDEGTSEIERNRRINSFLQTI